MKNALTHFYIGRINIDLPEQYRKEFNEKILYSNLLKSIFIGRFAVLFFCLIFILNYMRVKEGFYAANPMMYGIIVGHILLGVFYFPLRVIVKNKQAIIDNTFSFSRAKLLFRTILILLVFSLMIISLYGLYERNSSVTYPILIILINLIVLLHPKILFWINLTLFIIVIIGGILLLDATDFRLFTHFIETLGFTVPVYIGAVFYYNQLIQSFLYEKELEEKNKIIEKSLRTEFENKIIEIEMSALRAQMNPHFLFNALNSIKLYVVNNDSVTAADYLSKFAKLIRRILNNSKSKKVSLESELEALELYIQMEQFRFDFKFDYEIKIGENINKEFVELPPMLLQPYIENAIWHGLMHKNDGRGELKLIVERRGDNILFLIEDNGIGRKKSMSLKSNTTTRHDSIGMKITEDRLTMANKLYGTYANVKVEDKLDSRGRGLAIGTRVLLTLSSPE